MGVHGVLHREGAPGSGVPAAAGSGARMSRSHTTASAEEWARGGWAGLSGGSASSPAGCEFTSLYVWHLGVSMLLAHMDGALVCSESRAWSHELGLFLDFLFAEPKVTLQLFHVSASAPFLPVMPIAGSEVRPGVRAGSRPLQAVRPAPHTYPGGSGFQGDPQTPGRGSGSRARWHSCQQ